MKMYYTCTHIQPWTCSVWRTVEFHLGLQFYAAYFIHKQPHSCLKSFQFQFQCSAQPTMYSAHEQSTAVRWGWESIHVSLSELHYENCSLTKKSTDMAEHLTNLLRGGGIGTLLSVPHLGNHEKVLIIICLQWFNSFKFAKILESHRPWKLKSWRHTILLTATCHNERVIASDYNHIS